MSQRQMLDKLSTNKDDEKQQEITGFLLDLSKGKSSTGRKGAILERERLPDDHPSISAPETFGYDKERGLWGYGVLPAKEKNADGQQPPTSKSSQIEQKDAKDGRHSPPLLTRVTDSGVEKIYREFASEEEWRAYDERHRPTVIDKPVDTQMTASIMPMSFQEFPISDEDIDKYNVLSPKYVGHPKADGSGHATSSNLEEKPKPHEEKKLIDGTSEADISEDDLFYKYSFLPPGIVGIQTQPINESDEDSWGYAYRENEKKTDEKKHIEKEKRIGHTCYLDTRVDRTFFKSYDIDQPSDDEVPEGSIPWPSKTK